MFLLSSCGTWAGRVIFVASRLTAPHSQKGRGQSGDFRVLEERTRRSLWKNGRPHFRAMSRLGNDGDIPAICFSSKSLKIKININIQLLDCAHAGILDHTRRPG